LSEDQLLTLADYEERARAILPSQMFSVLFGSDGASGFGGNTSNLAAFRSTRLRPRVLAGVGKRNLSTTVLGHPIDFPVMLAPVGFQQRVHPEGEIASARAARVARTVFTLSTGSNYSIEEVASGAGGSLWFQLYFFRDRALNERLVQRAEEAGYQALVLTVDHLGRSKEMEIRYDFDQFNKRIVHTLQRERIYRNLTTMDMPGVPTRGPESFRGAWEWDLNWSDVDWLRARTRLPLVIKGIQTAEDAEICRERGVDAVVVSNHGGHGSPDAKGTLETLHEVVDAVRSEVEVYMDGGVRQGSDVLKALALGARAVFVGRANLWGLAIDGEEGVQRVLAVLRSELDLNMSLCGVTDVEHVIPSLVAPFWARMADGNSP
jgi:4-hydroxymandelate oxidase